MPEKPKRQNVSKTPLDLRPLDQIDSERERLPAYRANLSAKERSLLKDPDWIDEDEADVIICMRRESQEKGRTIPFREYLKRRGRSVAD
jgi:hypothetical protein